MSIEAKKLFEVFEVLKNDNDRLAAFKDLVKAPSSLMLVTDDDLTFTFRFIRLEKQALYMTPVEQTRKIKKDEIVYMIFSIASGQYAMRGPVDYTIGDDVIFTLNTELRRLQRRRNFRVNTLKLNTLKLLIEGVGEGSTPSELMVTDISAGGISAVVPTSLQGKGKLNQHVKCRIHHPVRAVSDLNGIVRHIGPYSGGERWGIEFVLASEQMQTMLALSLQVHRESLLIVEV